MEPGKSTPEAEGLRAGNWCAEELRRTDVLRPVAEMLAEGRAAMICGAEDAQKAWILKALQEKPQPVVIITSDQKSALRWEEDMQFFSPNTEILSFPVVENADFAVTFTGTEALRGRMRALSALLEGKAAVVLATASEAAQLLPAPEKLLAEKLSVRLGDVLERETLLAQLTERGYERVDQVERCGHFAVRGDIIDIFPINESHPYRVEFFDDEVDGIRQFDEDTQRSIASAEAFFVFPLHADTVEKDSLISYAGKGLVVFDEPQRGEEELKKYFREEKENRKNSADWQQLAGSRRGKTLVFSLLNRKLPDIHIHGEWTWKGRAVTNFQRQLPLFCDELSYHLDQGWRIGIVCANPSEKEEIASALRERNLFISDGPKEGGVWLTEGVVSKGFEFPALKLALYASGDVLGAPKLRRRVRSAGKGQQIRFFSDLEQGDYVVQRIHGIGRYLGLRTIEVDGLRRDYVTIQYAGGDKLYLPMEQIATLEKYIGPEGQSPVLSKMGGVQWEKIRSRAKASIQELAERLIAIYAKREITPGIAFDRDTREQREFEESFPYVETPDQLSAIEAIKRAMEKPEPMDMLLCGDVGFGKTEVAMRAVFKCVMSGYQAVVLVPTTVLSQQHYQTFCERMENFGIQIAVLNRFCTPKEKKEILKKTAEGTIDVLIGTHAILSKKIQCRRLGLLVVDEEQRFGVVQKEKWKARDSGIDVLTLSATPIPRTLHMSLTGVRDMVTITQAPSNRHAIQTYVTEYDDQIVREAILREKARGGQVYFVYNRIDSIDAMAAHLRSILPEGVTIRIAHGRMNGDLLEQIMFDFFSRKYDILLCTTLIENGVDQPNANTMIVYDADRMGLSQLYQMRGRVGRSDRIARAYFFYRKGKTLSEVAEKRLESIREFTELGSGFKIAMRDLEIRGAGNLLGAAQHGNIAAVGFASYCTMLDDAIRRLKAEKEHRPAPKKLPDTVIEFMQDAYIDESYIEKPEQKIDIYRRLAAAVSEQELEDLIDEVIDRFGTPTESAEKLFEAARLRILAQTLGIGSIVTEGDAYLLTWADLDFMKDFNIMKLPKPYFSKLRVLPRAPMRVKIQKSAIPGEPVKWLTRFLKEIHKEIGDNVSQGEQRA